MQTHTRLPSIVGGAFTLMFATWAYATDVEEKNEANPQPAYSPPAYSPIEAGDISPLAKRRHDCDLRSRALDKTACKAALRSQNRRAVVSKPHPPKSDWKAANTQLTSNLQWY